MTKIYVLLLGKYFPNVVDLALRTRFIWDLYSEFSILLSEMPIIKTGIVSQSIMGKWLSLRSLSCQPDFIIFSNFL